MPPVVRVAGSIPAWAGKLCCQWGTTSSCRSIPAWAGETAVLSRLEMLDPVYPRVGGGNGRPD